MKCSIKESVMARVRAASRETPRQIAEREALKWRLSDEDLAAVSGEEWMKKIKHTAHVVSTGVELGDLGEQAIPVNSYIPEELALDEHGNVKVVVLFNAITDEPNRPEKIAYGKTLAKLMGAVVIDVGTVGVEYSGYRQDYPEGHRNRLSEQQKRDLKRGNYSSIGSANAVAIDQVLQEVMLDESIAGKELDVTLVGGSMGMPTAVATLAATREESYSQFQPSKLVTLDGVGFEHIGLVPAIIAFIKSGGKVAKEYLKQNPSAIADVTETNAKWAGRVISSLGANALYTWAVTRGEALAPLEGGGKNFLEDVEALLVAGVHSVFKTEKPTKRAAGLMGRYGVKCTVEAVSDPHAVTMIVGAPVKLLRDVFQRKDGES